MYHYRISYLNLTRTWFCCIDMTRLDIIENLSIPASKTLHIYKNKKYSKKWKINVQFLFVNLNLINQYKEDCSKSFRDIWLIRLFITNRWNTSYRQPHLSVHFCEISHISGCFVIVNSGMTWPGCWLACSMQLINNWMLLWSKCFI